MKQSNNFRRMLRAAAVLTAAGMLTFAGCTKVDDSLGSNLIPENQDMKAGFTTLSGLKDGKINPNKYFETRLFQTDSIISSNINYGYFGSMLSDTFGLRSTGFTSQYLSYYLIDSGYFGYRPIFDSAQIVLSIKSYGGDTLLPQTFYVYEITDNKYLTEKPVSEGKTERDSIFYVNFDPEKEGIISSTPLFSFVFPDGSTTGPATTAVTMKATDAGREFVQRLMLQKGKYKGDYSIYSTDSLEQWVEEFKGVYIRPVQEATNEGGIYATALNASGLSIYGRNRMESDPTLIKDTIGMLFKFYDEDSKEYGNVSVNSVKRDYTRATVSSDLQVDLAQAVETNENRPTNRRIFVDGMGGVVTEITFTKEFFQDLEAVRTEENRIAEEVEHKTPNYYSTMAVSQAKLAIYFTDGDYDWQNIGNIPGISNEMDRSMARLGMYTDFKHLTAISDYAYVYEKTYSTTLAYGGYINRSRGCYVMDISGYLQTLWNSYLKEKKTAGMDNRPAEEIDWEKINWDNIENRSIYLAPEAYSLFATSRSVLQGMTDDANNAPIKLDLTYTMIK